MGRIFKRKQFSDYLGENRAILDIVTNYISGDTLTDLFVIPIGGLVSFVRDVYVSPSDEIFMTGTISLYGNCYVNNFIKLNSNGSLNKSYSGFTFTPSSGAPNYITPSSDGENLYLSGLFSSVNGSSSVNLVKVNKNISTVTQSYLGCETNASIRRVVEDGTKLVVPGSFTTWSGITRQRIVRLNSDGTVDPTIFSGTGFNQAVLGVVINNTGNYVCFGAFTTYSGVSKNRLVEIDSTTGIATSLFGSGMDTTSAPQAVVYDDIQDIYYLTSWNSDISYQSQTGRLIKVDGSGNVISVHSSPNFYGEPYFDQTNNILYGNDGVLKKFDLNTMSLDTQFTTNQGTWIGSMGTGLSVVKQVGITSKDKIIVGGSNFYFINGIQARMVASFNLNGTPNMVIGGNCE